MTDPARQQPHLTYLPARRSGLRIKPSGVVGLTLMALAALFVFLFALAVAFSE